MRFAQGDGDEDLDTTQLQPGAGWAVSISQVCGGWGS